MLKINQIDAGYGHSEVLFGLSMEIRRGCAATLLGRNGMGKTTTVRSIMGKVRCKRGEIFYNSEPINRLPSFKIARKGIGLVPEGRQIFPNLNVYENLIATAANYSQAPNPWKLEDILDLFPLLRARLRHSGNQLSGGEQQMLAIGRALMLNPGLLILDEATEGLAPSVRKIIWKKLDEIKQNGVALLLIDRDLDELNKIADYHYMIEKGKIVWQGTPAALQAAGGITTRYLGV